MAEAKKDSNSSVEGKKKLEKIVFVEGDSVDDMIEMEEAGHEIDFDVDRFPELGDEVKRLSKATRTKYFVARNLWLQSQKSKGRSAKSREIAERIEILGSMDMGARSIRKKAEKWLDKGMKLTYQPPEAVDYMKERHGYKEVKGPDGTYTIKGKDGKVEDVAMQIPVEKYKKHIDGVSKLSRRGLDENFEGTKEEAARTLYRKGEKVTMIRNMDSEDGTPVNTWPED